MLISFCFWPDRTVAFHPKPHYTQIGGEVTMEMQNITLSPPKDILTKVKPLAIDKRTSVSGLLAEVLVELVRQNDHYRQAKSRQLMLMEKGFNMGFTGKPIWSRDELHER